LTEVIADHEDRELANTVKTSTEVITGLKVTQLVIWVESVTEVLTDPALLKEEEDSRRVRKTNANRSRGQ
jgi:hypothetical protein